MGFLGSMGFLAICIATNALQVRVNLSFSLGVLSALLLSMQYTYTIGLLTACFALHSLTAVDVSDDFASDGLDEPKWNNGVPDGMALPGTPFPGAQPTGIYSNTPNGLTFSTISYNELQVRIGHFVASEFAGPLTSDWEVRAVAHIIDPFNNIFSQFDNSDESVALSLGVQNGANFVEDFGIELALDLDGYEVFSDDGLEAIDGDQDGDFVNIDPNSSVHLSIAYEVATGMLTSRWGTGSTPTNVLSMIDTSTWTIDPQTPFATISLTGFAEANVGIPDGVYWSSFAGTGLIPEPAAAPFIAALAACLMARRRQ